MTTSFRFFFFLAYAAVLWGFTKYFGGVFAEMYTYVDFKTFEFHPDFFWLLQHGFVFPYERVFISLMFVLFVVSGLRCVYYSYATPNAVPTKTLHRVCIALAAFVLFSIGQQYFGSRYAKLGDFVNMVTTASILGSFVLWFLSKTHTYKK
ncbi:hypothetical protein [Vibrio sp. WXL210]|uniref:hypothetical protein n=1 Tax=Vibrio sp. WXL210 TaxID=3450709 RepID=UPI003EC4D4F8